MQGFMKKTSFENCLDHSSKRPSGSGQEEQVDTTSLLSQKQKFFRG
jgi:hypothetical protein